MKPAHGSDCLEDDGADGVAEAVVQGIISQHTDLTCWMVIQIALQKVQAWSEASTQIRLPRTMAPL